MFSEPTDQIIVDLEIALAASNLLTTPVEFPCLSKENFDSSNWKIVDLDDILEISNQLFHLSTNQFIRLLPWLLQNIVHYSNDPRVGNIYNTVVYRLAYGPDRWSTINAADKEIAFLVVQAVTTVGEKYLNDFDEEARETMQHLISE